MAQVASLEKDQFQEPSHGVKPGWFPFLKEHISASGPTLKGKGWQDKGRGGASTDVKGTGN